MFSLKSLGIQSSFSVDTGTMGIERNVFNHFQDKQQAKLIENLRNIIYKTQYSNLRSSLQKRS